MSYIVIPIFSDPFLHPLHKDNGLSLLYIQEINKKSNMICQFHPDCVGVLEDYKWLDKHTIITPDAKILNHVYPFKNVVDMNWEWWSQTNQPFDMSKVRNNAYDFFHNKYYNARRLNEIIPILKHKEWCDEYVDLAKLPDDIIFKKCVYPSRLEINKEIVDLYRKKSVY